jgi:hypothetical protein
MIDRQKKEELAVRALAEAVPSGQDWHRANCPFCPTVLGKTDRKKSWGANTRSGRHHCFRCGTAGRLRGEFTDEAVRLQDGLEQLGAPPMSEPEGYMPVYEEPAVSASSTLAARRYLSKRRVSRDKARAAKIGVCLDGLYQGRVIVPVLDADQREWLGWVGRAWSPHVERAYTYPKGMKRAEILFNHAALLVATEVPAIVVEGVFDALAYWPNGVAVLGTWSDQQLEALASANRPVAVCLDGDAHDKGLHLALKLKLLGQRAGCVRLPPKVDPDEVREDALRHAALECIDQYRPVRLDLDVVVRA